MTFTLPILLIACFAAALLCALIVWLWQNARHQAAQHRHQQEADRLQHQLTLQQQVCQQNEQQLSHTAQSLADLKQRQPKLFADIADCLELYRDYWHGNQQEHKIVQISIAD